MNSNIYIINDEENNIKKIPEREKDLFKLFKY